ncbi:benzoylformate decarboxylase [Orrella daihaiensis]|uniref:Benzoylformate decarboxylase n=1 Tax=Orrella daihaiensis TaxID=2782176 RepID=A0ABY4ALU1_9BURK|nr:benzoylformate decarboxylase [Orrella daihaiensis]UOD51276.1 benzoylformate decarboxylase [Orrella daihaiensis]
MSKTVKQATFDLLRRLNLTTIVGNPGSTEETFLKDFPKDFDYILALQEASAVAIADGIAQSTRKPVIVNLHTGAGLGNAMGTLLTAFQNKTPLIITAGQQTREMLLIEPLLTNIEATTMPKPWVKWSYEPARAQDIPGAFMRAYATAIQQPAGPVFLSLPLDDWDQPALDIDVYRQVSSRVAPDPAWVAEFAQALNDSKNPALILGADIARSQAWDEGVELAQRLDAPVWMPPFCERTAFPETHRLYQGALPAAIGPLSQKLAGHDLILVVGAPVFRYYPYVAGDYLPAGARVLHVTDDPGMAAKAAVGHNIVGDSKLFLQMLLPQLKQRKSAGVPLRAAPKPADANAKPLLPHAVLEVLKQHSPVEMVLVEECPSIVPLMQDVFRIDKPDTFYTFASGGLGWNLPAAVGLALGEKQSGRNRPVICLMGDGSFQYSIQGVYSAVQQKTHLIYVVFQNEEYGILKQFAELEETPNVPGLDLPGLDIVSLSKGYGAHSVLVDNLQDLAKHYQHALATKDTTSVIVVRITKALGSLLG